jgi:hypothetical protein
VAAKLPTQRCTGLSMSISTWSFSSRHWPVGATRCRFQASRRSSGSVVNPRLASNHKFASGVLVFGGGQFGEFVPPRCHRQAFPFRPTPGAPDIPTITTWRNRVLAATPLTAPLFGITTWYGHARAIQTLLFASPWRRPTRWWWPICGC